MTQRGLTISAHVISMTQRGLTISAHVISMIQRGLTISARVIAKELAEKALVIETLFAKFTSFLPPKFLFENFNSLLVNNDRVMFDKSFVVGYVQDI